VPYCDRNAASLNPFWNCTTFLAILTSRNLSALRVYTTHLPS
jgi:hypothetical protein